MQITTLQTDEEIRQVLALQQRNLPRMLSADEQAAGGFVTVEHDADLLKRMNDAAPSIIAKDGEAVVGYCLTMLPRFKQAIPVLTAMFTTLEQLNYRGRPIGEQAYFVMGQICIADDYRGRGLFDALYARQRQTLGGRYTLVVTEVAERNTRSMRAHRRVGFAPLHTYHDSEYNETWVVLAWDWQN